MRSNNYFDDYSKLNTKQKIAECERVINDCKFWLSKTTNSNKRRLREKWIKEAQKRLHEINSK